MNSERKLEKKLSSLHVWALAFGCIISWGAFVMPGNTFLKTAGILGTAIGMLLGALVMILIAYNYYYMINKYPLAGGEFVYTRENFGEMHGFLCAWFLGLSYASLVPMNATALALLGRHLGGSLFQVGFHYTILGYDVYFGELLLSIVTLLLLGRMAVRDVKLVGRAQVFMASILILGVVVIATAAIFHPAVTVQNFFPLYYPGIEPTYAILAILAIAPWAFVGFDTIPQSAEEFRFSHKQTRFIMILSILAGSIIYIVLNTVTVSIIPQGYSNWAFYIQDLPTLNGLIALPTFYAAHELLGGAGLLFLGMSVLAAILSSITGFYMATSRLLYSMSIAGMIPAFFGELHKQYKTPAKAIYFHMALAIIAPFFGRNALGWLVEMSSLGAAIGYGYTSLAVFKMARAEQHRGMMATGVLGTMVSFIFIVLLLIPLPGVDTSLSIESYICLAVWLLLGIVFYYKRKCTQNDEEVDIVK